MSDVFLLTHNPGLWDMEPEEYTELVEATAAGHGVEGRWSTGGTKKKIKPGDRAFLLRQGVEPRGIIASGEIISEVFQAEHWKGEGGLANYADVVWDTAVYPEDCLPTAALLSELPAGQWQPMSSGTQVKPELVADLERLWADHITSVRPGTSANPATVTAVAGQARLLDVKLRKEIEDIAQDRLMEHYRAEGWQVVDTRIGNPFDAKASKNGDALYLEAKGTTSQGERVIVTRAEVAWARSHPGECVLGVVSGLIVRADGTVDPQSGVLRRYDWTAEEELLSPIDYDFFPVDDLLIE